VALARAGAAWELLELLRVAAHEHLSRDALPGPDLDGLKCDGEPLNFEVAPAEPARPGTDDLNAPSAAVASSDDAKSSVFIESGDLTR
jgi:hypothetical protein